ncbi:hypothetical protein KIS4809_4659 [Bacillus sp. ZZV12-4809]|nr:hypothetical protein KIS4809_4659 [Bacillus sp. ZZV12-4809]
MKDKLIEVVEVAIKAVQSGEVSERQAMRFLIGKYEELKQSK